MPVPSDTLYPSDTLFPGDDNQTLYSPQTIVGAQLIRQLAWLKGDDTLQWYMDAIGALFQQTSQIVLDQGTDGDADYETGYGSIFTPNPRFTGDTAICPTDQLPYLSQYVGVTLPPNASDAASRSLITAEAGFHRGTPSAIVAAAQRYLTGSQSVQNVERTRPDGSRSGYWFLLVVEPGQVTPNYVPNPSFEYDAIGAAPAGWTSVNSPSLFAVENSYGVTTGTKALRTTMPTTTSAYNVVGALTSSIPVTAGQVVSFGAQVDVLTLTGTACAIVGVFWNGDASSALTPYVTSTTAGQQELSLSEVTVPSGVTSVQMFIGLDSSTNTAQNAAGSIAVDAVQFTVGSTLPAYVDGDSPGASWSGTRGNSATTTVPNLIDAVTAVKPGGVMWQLVTTVGEAWDADSRVWQANATSWNSN